MDAFKKYFSFDNLLLAWERVIRSNDRLAKNQFGIRTYGNELETNLERLSEQLLKGNYTPHRPFKIYVPKASGMQRTKSVLHIEDDIVFQAIANIIAQNCYEEFTDNEDFIFGSILNDEVKEGTKVFEKGDPDLFFFKPYMRLYNRFASSVNKAILVDKVKYKLETDITGFFDSIPHYNLLQILSKPPFNTEDEILNLLAQCLNLWSGTRESMTPGIGIPQGPQASSFLANVVLHNLDDLIIGEGHTYYRYMDDIRIYGHEEEELLKALVQIDKYLKSIALSLNSKKTSIERVESLEEEQSTIKLLDYDEGEENEAINEFQKFAEQDGNVEEIRITITDPKQIAVVWKQQLFEAELELKSWFSKGEEGKLILEKEGLDEGEIREVSYRYRTALREINEFEECQPDESLIPYWLFLMRKFFWKAEHLCWVLNFYSENTQLKRLLFDLLPRFEIYEWVCHQIYMTLSLTQEFSKKELKALFQQLSKEPSVYSKLALFKLLIYHAPDKQFFTSVLRAIKKEDDIYIKKELLAYCQQKRENEFTMEELIESFGL
ncbi:MAG: hypothetical protein H6573_33595 [Lewinellaceae bacterium]|nr:hypothetical protein [Lewinellaceae bacterium]